MMQAVRSAMVMAGLAFGLSGCATIVEGSSQEIKLTSNAPNALCSISQNGQTVIAPAPVPAAHMVPKRPGNLIVDCTAEGYEPESVVLINGKHPMTVTGIMLTGILVNVGVDAISHSWHEYQDHAYVYLLPKATGG